MTICSAVSFLVQQFHFLCVATSIIIVDLGTLIIAQKLKPKPKMKININTETHSKHFS